MFKSQCRMRIIIALVVALLSVIDGYATVVVRQGKTFASQVKMANTCYEIQDDFDLKGTLVKIPSGCTLVFRGGSVRNGTIDLNGCRIEGVGIRCAIKNPTNYAYPLSRYLAETKDAELNRSVVQTLMDASVPVIIDYPRLEFKQYLSVNTNVTVQSASEYRAQLIFPNSRGFVWDKVVYSQHNNFKGLQVESKGHGFDMVNSGEKNRPRNVFFNTFSNLRVISNEGDCFTAGQGNNGAMGGTCVFDNLFELIEVVAPKGYGFVGISGNTHHFTKVRCVGCGKAFFYNCSGVFDSCNGTWGVTPTFYRGTRKDKNNAERYPCIFRNCNVESYTGVLFDCRDALCYMELTLEDCSFYITPNKNKVVDYYPFDFEVLFQLRMKNNFFYIYDNGKYDNKHNLFRVGYPSNLERVDVDRDMTFMDRHALSYTVPSARLEIKKK